MLCGHSEDQTKHEKPACEVNEVRNSNPGQLTGRS